jgi:hypothetical protein
MVDGELGGHECLAAAVAIVDDFEQVATLLGGQWCQAPIVEDQKLDTGEAFEEAYIPSISACQCECVEQAWYAMVEFRYADLVTHSVTDGGVRRWRFTEPYQELCT